MHPILARNLLLVLTLVGVAVGVAVGLVARAFAASPTARQLVALPGELFLNVLKALVLPLIAACVVSGLSRLQLRSSRRLIGAFVATAAVQMALAALVC